jgi:hypothetical protein
MRTPLIAIFHILAIPACTVPSSETDSAVPVHPSGSPAPERAEADLAELHAMIAKMKEHGIGLSPPPAGRPADLEMRR